MLGSSPSSRQVNRQGQKTVQMFPGNQIFLCVESSNSIPIAFKSCPLHMQWCKQAKKLQPEMNFSNWQNEKPLGEKNHQHHQQQQKNNYYAPHACSIFIDSLKANVSLKQERIKICVQSCCITYPWDWSAADEKALQDSSLNRHEIISPSDWD